MWSSLDWNLCPARPVFLVYDRGVGAGRRDRQVKLCAVGAGRRREQKKRGCGCGLVGVDRMTATATAAVMCGERREYCWLGADRELGSSGIRRTQRPISFPSRRTATRRLPGWKGNLFRTIMAKSRKYGIKFQKVGIS